MANKTLAAKRVAVLAADGFAQDELFETKAALEECGAHVFIVSTHTGQIAGWHKNNWGRGLRVDFLVDDISPDEFDALFVPGGSMSPDTLRVNRRAINFVKSFIDAAKPVGIVGHSAWLLIESHCVEYRTMTAWPSLQTDLRNAGANFIDEDVVVDEQLVTSRCATDLPLFTRRLIETIRDDWHHADAPRPARQDKYTIH